MAAKPGLRSDFLRLRDSLAVGERARADLLIRDNVASLPEFASAETVLSYVSVGSEVDTRGLIELAWERGKRVAAPRVSGPRAMEWYSIDGFDGLRASRFGVDEPPCDARRRIDPLSLAPGHAIALVPGLAFDAQGFRLGYGGGFYDAFLADFAGASIGLCRARQMSAAPLPHEAHDMPVDAVVTEEGARSFKAR